MTGMRRNFGWDWMILKVVRPGRRDNGEENEAEMVGGLSAVPRQVGLLGITKL
jgi:hypothetical protein